MSALLIRKVIAAAVFLGFSAGLLIGRPWLIEKRNLFAEHGLPVRFTEAELSLLCYGLAGVGVLFAIACVLFYKEK